MPRSSATHGRATKKLSTQRQAAADALLSGKAKTRGEACDLAGIPIGKAPKTRRNRASLVFREPAMVAYMEGVRAKATERAEISLERVLRELAAVGFSRATDYVEIDTNGLPTVDFSDLTDQQKAALAEMTVDQIDVERDGKRGKETTRVKFKLHDKLEALDKIARLQKWYVEQHEHTGPNGGPIEFISGFSAPPKND